MLQSTTSPSYSLIDIAFPVDTAAINRIGTSNGKIALISIGNTDKQAISKKAGKKAGGLLSGGGGGAGAKTNKVAKVSLDILPSYVGVI
jgi:hypothetical protein